MSDDDDKGKIILFPQPPPREQHNPFGRYTLVGHDPVPCPDLMQWARETERRWELMKSSNLDPWRVALTDIDEHVYVSTVFLGIDHNFLGKGAPILFETMIFRRNGAELPDGRKVPEDLFEYQDRCSTWDQAVGMHELAVAFAREQLRETGTL